MNFKEALIAHLQGEKVEVRAAQMDVPWKDFVQYHGQCYLAQAFEGDFGGACEYRLAPRTIIVNGVEVPAPESVAPEHGGRYCIPVPHASEKFSCFTWCDDRVDNAYLSEGLVYLREDQAIARAKAMLITQEAA